MSRLTPVHLRNLHQKMKNKTASGTKTWVASMMRCSQVPHSSLGRERKHSASPGCSGHGKRALLATRSGCHGKSPWRFQAGPELHGRNADAPVAPKPCTKIQAPLPKMQAAWPSTPSLPSVPPAKALVKPQQPCRVTGKAGKAYAGYYYESRKH